MNPTNQKFIDKLHPSIRTPTLSSIIAAEAALTGRAQPIITFGLRTFAEQQAIYDQGRTKPGQIVTKAKPGQSFHNYGLAIDIALLIDNKTLSWDTNKDWDADRQSDWMEVVAVFKREGFVWGGDWRSFKDMPHFEMTFNHTWQQLLALHEAREFIEGTSYVRIS